MIQQELKAILKQAGRAADVNKLYLKNLLKEYLQAYILFYIYTQDDYRQKLIFTGGTCLRHFYNLPRLSEDLDFDYLKKIDSNQLASNLFQFFKIKYQYKGLRTAVKQQGKQILLKFPVLKDLGLAEPQESAWLYVKIDLSQNQSDKFNAIMSSKSLYDFNFIAKHYDLPTLMAGKISAIFQRDRLTGKQNRRTIKGRDYFDLLWYLKKDVRPELERLKDLLGQPNLTFSKLGNMLDKKVSELKDRFLVDFKSDLIPLIKDEAFVAVYVENYVQEYQRAKDNIFN